MVDSDTIWTTGGVGTPDEIKGVGGIGTTGGVGSASTMGATGVCTSALGTRLSRTCSSNPERSNRSSTQISIFLSIPEMIASPIRTNMTPRIRLNQPLSSAIPRNLAMIDRHPIAMILSMSASPSA